MVFWKGVLWRNAHPAKGKDEFVALFTSLQVLEAFPFQCEQQVPAWLFRSHSETGFWIYTHEGKTGQTKDPLAQLLTWGYKALRNSPNTKSMPKLFYEKHLRITVLFFLKPHCYLPMKCCTLGVFSYLLCLQTCVFSFSRDKTYWTFLRVWWGRLLTKWYVLSPLD